MARSVKGFLADDGTFFNNQDEVELYEALNGLRFASENVGADPNKLMIIVDAIGPQIRRYLDAKESYNKAERGTGSIEESGELAQEQFDKLGTYTKWADRAREAAPLTINTAEFLKPETGVTPVQQQPADEREHVPDVGSGERTEAVSDKCEEHGAGVRSAHARSVRSRPYMATTSTAALDTARKGRGGQDI